VDQSVTLNYVSFRPVAAQLLRSTDKGRFSAPARQLCDKRLITAPRTASEYRKCSIKSRSLRAAVPEAAPSPSVLRLSTTASWRASRIEASRRSRRADCSSHANKAVPPGHQGGIVGSLAIRRIGPESTYMSLGQRGRGSSCRSRCRPRCRLRSGRRRTMGRKPCRCPPTSPRQITTTCPSSRS
jgi:hypothetical protein